MRAPYFYIVLENNSAGKTCARGSFTSLFCEHGREGKKQGRRPPPRASNLR